MAINLTEEEKRRRKKEEEAQLAKEQPSERQANPLTPVGSILAGIAPASPVNQEEQPSPLIPNPSEKQPLQQAPTNFSRFAAANVKTEKEKEKEKKRKEKEEYSKLDPMGKVLYGGKQFISGLSDLTAVNPFGTAMPLHPALDKGPTPKEEIEKAVADVGLGGARVITPIGRAVVESFDPDTALTREIVNSEKTGQAIREGEKAFKQQQLLLMGHEVLDLKNQGVTKKDALATLEGMKGEIPATHYETLKERLEAQYAAPAEGPVTNPELEEIKQRQENRRNGKGDPDGHVTPKVTKTDEQQAMEFAATQVGQNAAFGFNTPPVWYESDAFSSSLITFGLGILSGQDYATAFAASSKVFDTNFEKEKRKAYANELTAQGYSKQQIMEWIEKGDASALEHKETFHTDWDDYGYFQQSSTTGEKKYLTSREELLTSQEDRKYKKLQTAQKLKELTGGGDDDEDITKGAKPKNLMSIMYSLGYDEELADLASNDDNTSGFLKNAFAGWFGDDGKMAADMGLLGDDASRWAKVMSARRQFIEYPLRLVTGAVIAHGEESVWARTLFVTNKEERTDGPNGGYEGSTAQRKKRLRTLLTSQANAIYEGKKSYTVPTAHVRILLDGKATPLRDQTTGMIRGIEFADGSYELYEPMTEELRAKRIREFNEQTSKEERG